MGAISFLTKPVTSEGLDKAFEKINEYIKKDIKTLLVVEDNKAQQKSIVKLVGNGDVKTIVADTGQEAFKVLKHEKIDCMVIDLGLPDISGIELIKKINKELGITDLPIITYTGKELTEKEETELKKVSKSIIIKGADSMERLLNETSLFLHRVEKNLPEQKQKLLKKFHQKDPALSGKKVIIIDDDKKIKILFSVSDTGIGIPDEKKDCVFNSFNQADTCINRIYGGTGLGLTISKKLVELMGGKIWFDSKVGEGSTFYFTVDLEIAEENKKIDVLISSNNRKNNKNQENQLITFLKKDNFFTKNKPMRILLAEDNLVNSFIVLL